MKLLVVYDSQYGNTEKIALSMDKNARHVSRVTKPELKEGDWLIAGCPTQGGRPTAAMTEFLENLPKLEGVRAAVFDTRLEADKQVLPLRMLIKTVGYAGEKMEKIIKNKGCETVPAAGFIVTGKEGPLKDGEIERAKDWIKQLTK